MLNDEGKACDKYLYKNVEDKGLREYDFTKNPSSVHVDVSTSMYVYVSIMWPIIWMKR